MSKPNLFEDIRLCLDDTEQTVSNSCHVDICQKAALSIVFTYFFIWHVYDMQKTGKLAARCVAAVS